ncbi:MAG: class I SAM-dependent methyltransferase [Lentihominibacter sp.]
MEIRTLEFYNKNAEEYACKTFKTDMSEPCDRFLKHVAPGGKILDLGCGSGRDSIYFMDCGYDVCAVDGSEELCRIASENTGIHVRRMLFQELDYYKEFDGIWACASLLHVPGSDLPGILAKVYDSLKDGGVFYTCFKYGDGEEIRDGKYYTDMTEERLDLLLRESGFEIIDLYVSGDSLGDREDLRWVNVIGLK